MKLKHYLTIVALALWGADAQAQQPYSGCWFPNDVRDWTPEYDTDAKFNRSRVPLKKKLSTPQVMKANEHQFTEGQLMLASVSAKMCGQCAAQGFDNFIGYNPTYWQYVEKLVNWGGADDEGIVVFPPAGTIDAAHTNGTKIFANIFLQNTTNGLPWAKQLVTCEGDKYPYAESLYKMAKYYGIDGYFINDESHQGLTDSWIKWMKYFFEVAEADGDTNMEIVWYDANYVPDIEVLNVNPRISHFIDYSGGVQDYRHYADKIGSTVDGTFHRIYGGIECGRSGLKGFNDDLNKAFPRTGHVGSAALFCVEEHTWKDNVNKLFFTENARGERAYTAMRKTFEYERATFINDAGDPSKTVENGWRGISGCLVESTTIDGLPFITSFNVGNGKHRFAEGVKMGTRDWSHSGMQSYLPTWRWWIENGDGLKESIDWDDAYCGGNSMLISGTLSAGSHMMRLYKMIAKVDNGGTVRLVYKSNNPTVPVLHLSTESSVTPDTEIQAKGTSQINGWTVAEYDLASVAGKTIYMVAFDLKADAAINSYEMRLGQMVMIPAGYSPKAVDITNVSIERPLGKDGGDLRVTWDWADNSDLDRFDIYTVDATGVRTLVGQTRDEGFYIPEIKRSGTEAGIDVEIIPVMKDGSNGVSKKITAMYAVATAPVIKVKSSRSYAKIGDEIDLTASGTDDPTECHWTLPEGLSFAKGADASSFKTRVVVNALGIHNVTVSLKNNVGTSEQNIFAVEGVTPERYSEISNVALNKTIIDQSAPFNSWQNAETLINGDRDAYSPYYAWCANGKHPYATLDLGEIYIIYGFSIFDSQSAFSFDPNISNYRIQLSLDGKNWTEVVDETGREGDDVKYDYITPQEARYVRLSPYSEIPITTKIWEFEVYGRVATHMSVTTPQSVLMNKGEKKDICVKYDLNGEKRSDNFSLNVKYSGNNLIIGKISEDIDNNCFNFDITATDNSGVAIVEVELINGKYSVTRTFSVAVDDPDAKNILPGIKAMVSKFPYGADYGGDEYPDIEGLTDSDKETNALLFIEDASLYDNDLLVTFEFPDVTPISKLRIYFPENNYLIDSNDIMSEAVKDVTIKYNESSYENKSDYGSKDLELLSINNVGKTSMIEKIFPTINARTVHIWINNNYGAYPSLAEIEMYSPSGTSSNAIIEVSDAAEIDAIYTLQGVRLEAPAKGINIIRYTDGTTRKVIVR